MRGGRYTYMEITQQREEVWEEGDDALVWGKGVGGWVGGWKTEGRECEISIKAFVELSIREFEELYQHASADSYVPPRLP